MKQSAYVAWKHGTDRYEIQFFPEPNGGDCLRTIELSVEEWRALKALREVRQRVVVHKLVEQPEAELTRSIHADYQRRAAGL